MIKIDENDPVGEVDPSFPFRDVVIKKNTDMKQFYELQKEIGRGKFGTVYRCTEKSTGLKLAAKFINTAKRQDRRNAEREVEIMKELQHPRLIQIYDAYEIHNTMCVVLELIEGGELFERVIDDDFVLTEKSVSVFMKQICEGVAFIHSKNILHLDMKPENILCLSRNGNRIKIIDFGLARKYDPEKKLQVLFGTPEFVAPEVVNFESIGYGTDMWSVGVICYVLLSGLSPFMGETDVQTMANVTIAHYDFDDEAFNDISKDAKDFIAKLLVKDREVRMSSTECLSHDWLRRRNTESSCNDLVSKQALQINTDGQRGSELEYQKDTLRNIVDRWNDDAHMISVPTITNGESKEVSKGNKSKLTDPTAANPEVKTNQPGHKPKTKIIIRTKKIKKKDASSNNTNKDASSTNNSKQAANTHCPNLEKLPNKDLKTNENLVSEVKKTSETVISNEQQVATALGTVKPAARDAKNNENPVSEVKRASETVISEEQKAVSPRGLKSTTGDAKNKNLVSEKTSEIVIPKKKENTTPSSAVKLATRDTGNDENVVDEEKRLPSIVNSKKEKKLVPSIRSTEDNKRLPVVLDNDKKEIKSNETTTGAKIVKKQLGDSELKCSVDRSHKPVNSEGPHPVEKDDSKTNTIVDTTDMCSRVEPASQPEDKLKSANIAFKENTLVIQNESQASSNDPDDKVEGNRKSPVRKTTSPAGKRIKKISKSVSPKVNRKTYVNSKSESSPPENTLSANLPVEGRGKQTNKLVTNFTETVKSIFTRSLSKEGNGPPGNSISKEIKTTDPQRNKSIRVEVSDESYQSVKKCTFIIKNITKHDAKEDHKETNAPNHRSSSTSDEETEPTSNAALRRRISDITSLLSRGDRSAEEIASLRKNLSQLHNLSKSLSCGENGNFSSKRPKYRISCFSRDVPLANQMNNCQNISNLVAGVTMNGNKDAEAPWSFRSTTNHSDPGSLRTSPERFCPPSLSTKILSRFFSNAMDYDLPANVPSSSTTA